MSATSTPRPTTEFEIIDKPHIRYETKTSLIHQLQLMLQSEMIAEPWRRAVGLCLLSTTVFLWTASGFLASAIFADASYPKPYFITFFDNLLFMFLLLPFLSKHTSRAFRERLQQSRGERKPSFQYQRVTDAEGQSDHIVEYDNSEDVGISDPSLEHRRSHSPPSTTSLLGVPIPAPKLTTRETFWLSFRFALLWFISNYMNAASLQYTTVASTTILSSTSSVFTLILGAVLKVEKFTWRKTFAVVTCLIGVFLVSNADTSGNEGDRGDFPFKSPQELALGDAMALGAALLYGIYAVTFVKAVGDESRVNMSLFFGFIGLVTLALLWPGLLILHWSGVESFAMPPDGRTWAIVLINGVSSVVADLAWIYSLVLVSPLVITVGLSLTIPLSLLGQIVLNGQFPSVPVWIGAAVVLTSFVFINHQSKPIQEHIEHLPDST